MPTEDRPSREQMIEIIKDMCPGETDYLDAELEDAGYERLTRRERSELLMFDSTGNTAEAHRASWDRLSGNRFRQLARDYFDKKDGPSLMVLRDYLEKLTMDVGDLLSDLGYREEEI